MAQQLILPVYMCSKLYFREENLHRINLEKYFQRIMPIIRKSSRRRSQYQLGLVESKHQKCSEESDILSKPASEFQHKVDFSEIVNSSNDTKNTSRSQRQQKRNFNFTESSKHGRFKTTDVDVSSYENKRRCQSSSAEINLKSNVTSCHGRQKQNDSLEHVVKPVYTGGEDCVSEEKNQFPIDIKDTSDKINHEHASFYEDDALLEDIDLEAIDSECGTTAHDSCLEQNQTTDTTELIKICADSFCPESPFLETQCNLLAKCSEAIVSNIDESSDDSKGLAGSVCHVEGLKTSATVQSHISIKDKIRKTLHENAKVSTTPNMVRAKKMLEETTNKEIIKVIESRKETTNVPDVGPFYGLPSKVQTLLEKLRKIKELYGKYCICVEC